MPYSTPQKFTPITHCQSRSETSQIGFMPPAIAAMPALLQTMCTLPNSSIARFASASHRFAHHRVGDHADHAMLPLLEFLHRAIERVFLDVGEHDLHARLRETLGERAADSAGRTGDNRGFSFELLHGPLFPFSEVTPDGTRLSRSQSHRSRDVAHLTRLPAVSSPQFPRDDPSTPAIRSGEKQ